MSSGDFHSDDDAKSLRKLAKLLSHGRSVDMRAGMGELVGKLVHVRCKLCGELAGTLEEYEHGLMWLSDGQRTRVTKLGHDLLCPRHGVLPTPEDELVDVARRAQQRRHVQNWRVAPVSR